MSAWHELLIKKLTQHSGLSCQDGVAVRSLSYTQRLFKADEDIVKQGDKPKVSAVVVRGTLARYHTLQGGRRQYLSLHIAGDMPDSQTLFLDHMDHAVCAVDEAVPTTHRFAKALHGKALVCFCGVARDLDRCGYLSRSYYEQQLTLAKHTIGAFFLRTILSRARRWPRTFGLVQPSAHSDANWRNRGGFIAVHHPSTWVVAKQRINGLAGR